jgi:uncharacterized protein
MARAEATTLQVEVVYCPAPRRCDSVSLRLDEGACLHDALRASGLCQRHGLDAAALRTGIWGRVQPLQALLRDQDRVELYRPLKVDPKEARRLRYRHQKR